MLLVAARATLLPPSARTRPRGLRRPQLPAVTPNPHPLTSLPPLLRLCASQTSTGEITPDKLKKILEAAGGWVGDKRTMQTVLLAIRNQLRSKSMPKQQPPDGTTYS